MKKIFKIFFEEIPLAELNVERKLKWKMFLPKSADAVELVLLKVVFLLLPMFLLIYFLFIVFALLFRISQKLNNQFKITNMSQIVYIGIKLIKISPENPFQLLISDNAGISWEVTFYGSEVLGEFFELGKRDLIVFAKTSTGKFRSTSKGRTWTRINC